MRITLIAAMAKNRVIGCNNKLPWHLPADLKYFKRMTRGHAVVMGRHTMESIGCKPLPQRLNIVMSRRQDILPPGFVLAHSVANAVTLAGDADELMVIGGQQIYQAFMPYAHCMLLTEIDVECAGDVFFPGFTVEQWQLEAQERGAQDAENPYAYAFVRYVRPIGAQVCQV